MDPTCPSPASVVVVYKLLQVRNLRHYPQTTSYEEYNPVIARWHAYPIRPGEQCSTRGFVRIDLSILE